MLRQRENAAVRRTAAAQNDSALARSQGAVKLHPKVNRAIARLMSDWAVAPSGEHDAQIGAVHNAVQVEVADA